MDGRLNQTPEQPCMAQLFFLFPCLVECAAAVNWEAPRRSVPGEVASWAGTIPVQLSFEHPT